jgi:hypothetical protein
MIEVARRIAGQPLRQFFRRLAGEEGRMGVCQLSIWACMAASTSGWPWREETAAPPLASR